MHLPRSVFSQRQLDLLTWVLHINGISDVPSVKTLKNLEDGLQKICGIKTLSYEGALGHKYFMNSFADIVQQVIDIAMREKITDEVSAGNGQSSCSA